MLDFKEPKLEDMGWIKAAGESIGLKKNDAGFVNLSLLKEKYGTKVYNYNGTLLRFYPEGYFSGCYGIPVGDSDYKEVVQTLLCDAKERGLNLKLMLLSDEDVEKLEVAFPGEFSIEKMEDYTEYLHLREKVSVMSGEKFSKKRNHIKNFHKRHPNAEIKPMTSDNIQDAYAVARGWLDSKPEEIREHLEYEYRAIKKAGENFDAWGMKGIIIYDEGRPVGMEMVSELSKGVYDIHFEKALPEYPHIWSVIVKESATYLEDAVWINREEDLGDAGLRKSKLSYRPDLLLEKYKAVYKGVN